MPVAAVTSVLEVGFTRLFIPETAPPTTEGAARVWANSYVQYAIAGGVVAANTREAILGNALASAFRPELAGAGQALLLQALSLFWIGMPIPAQAGTATAFIPLSPNVTSPQSDKASSQDQARGLAQVIAGLTLGAVKVTVPPAAIVPLL